MDLELRDKRVFVSGSSSGIGAGIARYLAAEGTQVVVHGRNTERLELVRSELAETGADVVAAPGDLATDEGAEHAASIALEAFGGIDILVNNAGGSSPDHRKSWFDLPLGEWSATYEMNVVAAGRLIHRFVPGMRERQWGRVIQISSAAGIIPTSGQPDYGPAKAAMINLSMGLSKALAATGITVNTVTPGMIMTEGLMNFLRAFAAKRGWGEDTDRAAEYVLKGCGQTVDRIGQVEDIAYAVAFLASPKGSFLNGVNLHVDGGGTQSIY
ncbi:SDR family oxidoreductase [Acidiferrimicrobium sp. IK]|uniref:SDR family NAD(P)-dependent oxidoreductase n=1 Tax=Acidiferrimicrobium sp. IK TaxID=2871700 RepID=UPI0021CB61DE|nr:SDR family NAD(P)-dependent oxidoreductase [Acidiferrimicrobium sp. IK]MCU4186827.1 SDR family oxidoreductase [Acidiferrimicrobium sp. IK]